MDRDEAMLRELFDQAPDGVFIGDAQDRLVDVNTAGCQRSGYAREELIGRSVADFVPPEDLEAARARWKELRRRGAQRQVWRFRRKDGTEVAVEVSARVLAGGGWVAFVRDVSDRVGAEQRAQRLVRLQSATADLGQRALRPGASDDILREAAELVVRALEVDLSSVAERLPGGETFLLRAGVGWREGVVGHATVPAAGTQPEYVIRTGQPVIIEDAAAEHRFRTLAWLLGETTVSSVSVVIATREGPYGALAAHSRRPRTFNRDEVDFLRSVANVLGAAIERGRAEDALRASEASLNRAQAVAHVGSWHFDVARNRVTWSDEVYRIFGVPVGTPLTYERFIAFVHPDDREGVNAAWAAALHGAPYDIVYRLFADGTMKWVHSRAEVTFDEHGAAIEGIGSAQDITEQQRLEQERRLWAETLDAIIGISADAMISIGPDQRIVMFNEGAEVIFGWRRDEIRGRPVDLLIPERFRASHREQVAAFARGPTRTRKMGAAGREIFGLRKNGEEFPVEASISKAEVGGRLLLNVSLRDVTDTRRTEDEQRFLADLGEALIGAAPDYDAILDGIARAAIRSFADLCLVDLAGTGGERRRLKIAHADPAKAPTAKAIERLGIERGRSPYLRSIIENGRPVLAGEVPPGLLASVAQDEENLRRMEALGIRSFIAVPVLGQRGTVGVIAFVSSRPFRRYGARDLRLAERVATLAALAVENARLHDLALRAVRARDEVLGIVAHDLRNPLQSISLQAEYLEGEACDPLAVQGIRQSAKRMSRLVQDMLDVAHLEAGPLAIRRAPTPARSIAADAVEAQLSVAAASSLDLRLELPDDLPDVLADRDRLLQILDNLIGNALKFTPAGGRVTVGATADGEEVRFRVTDTGPGIPPDDLPHVFDRFWQAKRSDRRGAGLGLAIALGLVEAHGGRITVESVPGHGATFTFTVPVAR